MFDWSRRIPNTIDLYYHLDKVSIIYAAYLIAFALRPIYNVKCSIYFIIYGR